MKDLSAKNKITKAQTGLILDAPFFGSLILRMKLKEDPACETFWTDGKTIGYSPQFVDSLSLPETKGVLAHEVMHVAAQHNTRRQDRDPGKWNSAGDYEINHVLKEADFTLPEDVLFGYPGEGAEEIYNKLPDQPSGGGQGGDGDGQGQADPGKCGEVRDLPGKDGGQPSPAEVQEHEQQMKAAVTQAAQVAKKAGKLTAGLERMVDKLTRPKVDWKAELHQFAQAIARNDYTWRRPNPRYMSSNLYLPSLYSEEMGIIALAIDTSGSVSEDELTQFASELQAIMDELKPEKLYVMYVDTELAGIQEFSGDDVVALEPRGGGGTDFRPPFEHLEEQGIDPACFVYLTDLHCSSFPEAPGYPVLWVVNSDRRDVPFGDVVPMEM